MTIGELVRKKQRDFKGKTQISEYVSFSMHYILERIDAYLNSKHISGDKDSLGREKPFFNTVISSANIWYRATDIDTSNILLKATKSKDWIDSFLATIHLREWMKKENFGKYLNEWGRVLARYGSAVTKTVHKNGKLYVSVVPWNRLIVDSVNFESNPKIELIELTEGELRQRIKTHGYNKNKVDELVQSLTSSETVGGQKKDNDNKYIKLYEVHGYLPLSYITNKDKHKDIYVQQMHIISYNTTSTKEHNDFTLYSGRETKDPYRIAHLIKEDGRTLAIGAVEHLFESQWMINHSMKAIKDQLDLASRTIFQTSDLGFVGRNVIKNIQSGDILTHEIGKPLTQLNNVAYNATPQQGFADQWRTLGREINGISEAMLGASPKSGTAWRQTEATLDESYSLFQLMTENKGLYLVDLLREDIIPYIKKSMDTAKEVSATLEQYEIEKIDSLYVKNEAIRLTNDTIKDELLNGEMPQGIEDKLAENEDMLRGELSQLGNQRFFSPSEINWKEQFKDLEWELEVDITGEQFNSRAALATLNTALKLVVTPGFEQNKRAQMIVGKILSLTGTFSPIEYNAIPAENAVAGKPVEVGAGLLPENN